MKRDGRWSRLGLALVLGALPMSLGACRPKEKTTAPASGDPWEQRALEIEAHLGEHPDDQDAWRDLGHLRWIHLGQTSVGRSILERNAAQGDLVSRLSLLLMAEARDEADTLAEHAYALLREAAQVAPGDEGHAFAQAATAVAARRIQDAHGEREGDDDAFIALYDELWPKVDAGRAFMSPTARRAFVSQRAAIARRLGKPYRAMYETQGCVQSWAVGPVQGHLGALDLPTVDPRMPIAVDGEATLAQLACVVRVWNPAPSPGVRRMRAEVDVPGDTLRLELGAQFGARVYVDGEPVYATDAPDRFLPSRVALAVDTGPGRHALEVVTAIPGERAWVMVRATDARGAAVDVVAKPSTGSLPDGDAEPLEVRRLFTRWTQQGSRTAAPIADPIYAPLRAVLAIDDALGEGDSDRAELQLAKLEDAERFADGFWARARFERADPSRGAAVSGSRERQALEAALKADPTLDRARRRLLEQDLSRGEEAEVGEAVTDLGDERLAGLRGQLFRYRLHRRLGQEHLAQRALDRAETINPASCSVLLARRSIARERDDVRAEDELGAKLLRCGGTLELRADLAARRGDHAQAEQLWVEALDRVPDDIEAHQALAEFATLAGDHDRARKHLEAILALSPYRVSSHVAMADLAATGGDAAAARTHLQAALQTIPHSAILRRAADTLGVVDDLDQWRIDGATALAEYQKYLADGGGYEGVGEVLALDRSAVRVYATGGQRQIVHIIVHLLSKEALDRYGELSLPDSAQLMTLHTIKPDGTRLDPEVIGGKDGVSLRDLEVGDFVEYEYAVESGPTGSMPGYVDVSTFRFRSLDVPYHRSELLVVHPASMPIAVDRRNGPPKEVTDRIKDGAEDVVTRYWRADQVTRLGVEPGHRPLLEELPNVRVYTKPELRDFLGTLAAQVRDAARTNPALRRQARRLTARKKSQRAKLEALWKWTVERVEEGGDLSVPATVTLAGKAGNRTMLLYAMLRAVGIDVELWLLKDKFGVEPQDGGHPMLETYDAPILAVKLPGDEEPIMVTTASKVVPMGYLAPGLRGASAMRLALAPGERSGPVEAPALAQMKDGRVYDLDVALDATGQGAVSGTIALSGMEAVVWRQALSDIDRDRIEEVFTQAELGWLRGAQLSELEILGEDDLEQPLVLKFSATAPGMGVQQDGALRLRAAPMPLNPAARYAALPRRTTGLVVPYAPEHEVRVRYRIEGATFTAVPKAQAIESPFGRFSREVASGGPGESSVELRIRSTLRTGVVEPAAYPQLAEYGRAVDEVVGDWIEARVR